MKRKLFAILLILALMGLTPLQALAAQPNPKGLDPVNYLSLGDSIAYGMSSERGMSYFDQYSAFKRVGSSINLAVPGATTNDLLLALNTPRYQMAVKRSDVITISIGGNNLLKPIQDKVSEILGTTDLTDGQAIQEGLQKLADYLSVTYYPIPFSEQDALDWLAASLIGEAMTPMTPLYIALGQGIADFIPDIIETRNVIQGINPDAKIIFLNLYNPFVLSENPALYGLFENLAAPMNLFLGTFHVPAVGSFVADVHSAFYMEPDAVDFSLDLETLNLDIHPSPTGHDVICDLLEAMGAVIEFQPPKPE